MENTNIICHCEIWPYRKWIEVTVIQYDNVFESTLVDAKTCKTIKKLKSKSLNKAMEKYRILFKEWRNIIYPL